MENCDILSFDMCTLESSQESLFFLKTESGVTFSQKVESTPNAEREVTTALVTLEVTGIDC